MTVATYRGPVCNGRGRATKRTEEFAPVISEYLGEPMVPGTLNIILSEPIELDPSRRISVLGDGRSLWAIKVGGVSALAYRWPSCPLHVIEAVSSVWLRQSLGLANDDEIELEIPADILTKPNAFRRAAWNLIWKGRERTFYKNDLYPIIAALVPVLRGASAQTIPGTPPIAYTEFARRGVRRITRPLR